ncbi:unnamed protein product, partial [Bubo scandiacus]
KQPPATGAEAQRLCKNNHVFHSLKSVTFLPQLKHLFHQLPDSAMSVVPRDSESSHKINLHFIFSSLLKNVT